MRIVLVHPAGSNWVPGRRDVAAVANRMAPLGLLSIAAFLEKRGHEVFVHDCLGPGRKAGSDEDVRRIISLRPDLVGFSVTTSGFHSAHDMAAAIKKRNHAIRILFGGVHVSALGASLLEGFGNIDYLCVGEGEQTLAELAEGGDPASVKGLVRKSGDAAVTNPPREPIRDLDSLPFPAYEKLRGFPSGYNLPLFSYIRTPGATMVTSRGCTYACSYCDRSVFGRSFRSNSAEYIYEHMSLLRKDFGVRHISIYDDLFTLQRGRVMELCGMLMRKPLGIRFNCAVRVGHADNDLLSNLKRAGCLTVSVGIESADPEILRRHKSGVSLEDVRDTVAGIQGMGLRAKGLFMMGLPGETEDTVKRTAEFILSLGLDDMNMSKFTPFPGAPITGTIREEGTIDEDWRLMNCLNFVFVPKGISSKERLDRLYNGFVKSFYMSPSYRKKFMKRLWQNRRSLMYMIRHIPSLLEAKRTFENR